MYLRSLLRFCSMVLFAITLLGFMHLALFDKLDLHFDSDKMIASYSLSTLLSIAACFLLVLGLKKNGSSLGFLFMWTAFIKFGIYLVVFKWVYSVNSEPRGVDLSIILLPYLITLFLEVYFLTRMLKDQDEKE